MDNNVADISVFESLQADQHAKTGMSQMSVFNETPEFSKKAAGLDALLDGLVKDAKVISEVKVKFSGARNSVLKPLLRAYRYNETEPSTERERLTQLTRSSLKAEHKKAEQLFKEAEVVRRMAPDFKRRKSLVDKKLAELETVVAVHDSAGSLAVSRSKEATEDRNALKEYKLKAYRAALGAFAEAKEDVDDVLSGIAFYEEPLRKYMSR
ncbi:MAG: hypothetical protein LBQ66_09130 [Planctomycetaceae bacterium]|jgi:hypothetical protein|nr:hypothetical protein [Planctomycetaceae bacterium]